MSVDKEVMEVLEKNQNIKVVHFYNLCEKESNGKYKR